MKLCIDPGHGGDDKGCQHNGLIESDYVLDMAYLLADFAKKHGVFDDILLTRTSQNERVGLARRAEISKSWDADFTISLHVNAGRDPREHGPIAFRLFGVEKSAEFCESFDEFCLDGFKGEYVDGDKVKPMKTHNIIARPIPDHWTARAFNVLSFYSSRPVVLVELGYATHKHECANLLSGNYQHNLVDMICASCLELR